MYLDLVFSFQRIMTCVASEILCQKMDMLIIITVFCQSCNLMTVFAISLGIFPPPKSHHARYFGA